MTDEEVEIAYAAFEEWSMARSTARRCPWCDGEFRFKVVGNSYEIRCERVGCFKLTSRGL